MNTPLAEALHREIQPKLVECGWAPNDASDTTMAEYLILMIVNGKTEQEIAAELSSDLLNLPPEDDSARQFARWLFELIESENAKINGPAQQAQPEPTSPSGDHEMDMDLTGLDTTEGVHAYVSILRILSRGSPDANIPQSDWSQGHAEWARIPWRARQAHAGAD